jgi:hypothetical protein
MTKDLISVRACLRSGLCCTTAPCGYGEVTSNTDPSCKFLLRDDDQRTQCGKFKEISQDPASFYSPAFGQGCCMPLGNSDREKIRAEFHNNKEVYVKVSFK